MSATTPETSHEYCPTCDGNIFIYPVGLDGAEEATTPSGERLVLCMACLSLLILTESDALRLCTQAEWDAFPAILQAALMDQAGRLDRLRRSMHLLHDIFHAVPVPPLEEEALLPDLPQRPVIRYIH